MFLGLAVILISYSFYTKAAPQLPFTPAFVPYNLGYYYLPYSFVQKQGFQDQRHYPFAPYLHTQPIPLLPFLAHSQKQIVNGKIENKQKQLAPQINSFYYPAYHQQPLETSVPGVSSDDHRIDYIITPPEISGAFGDPSRAAEQKHVIGIVPQRPLRSDDGGHLHQLFPFNELRRVDLPNQQFVPVTKSSSKCGLRLNNEIGNLADSQEVSDDGSDEDTERARESMKNTPLQSLEWGGPDLSKTIFFEKGGINPFLVPKITYGEVAARYEAPWQVAIFTKGRFHCGASIIGEAHLLTAAHCVVQFIRNPSALKIVLGDWDLRSNQDGTGVEVVAESISSHEGFSYYTLQNDIAVIKLKNTIPFSNKIQPICLPNSEIETDDLVTVTGWGRNEANRLQTKLQKIEAAVVSHKQCSVQWSTKGISSSLIGPKTLCMNTQYGDSCKGDSGGPAWKEYPAASGSFIQVGIVSFGSGSCTDINLPGVYTRVTAYLPWIAEQISY